MPEGIYGIDVGQVQAPSGSGGGTGRMSPVGGSLNALLRSQQKAYEYELKRQEQERENKDKLFQGLVGKVGLGVKDDKEFMGFTPNNPFEAEQARRVSNTVAEKLDAFANSKGGNKDYSSVYKDIRKTLYDENFLAAGRANAIVNRAVGEIQKDNLNVHPLYMEELSKYQNADDLGKFRISILQNPREYAVPEVNHEEDFKQFKDKGVDIRTEVDPNSGATLLVTSQHNKGYIKDYYKQKYNKLFDLDYEYAKEKTPLLVENISKNDYIEQRANDMADAFDTDENRMKASNLGLSIKEYDRRNDEKTKQAQEEEAAKNIEKLKLAKEKDAISDENSKIYHERQLALQEKKGAESRKTVSLMTDAQKEMAKEHGKNVIDYRKVPGVKQEDVNIAVTKVNKGKGESKRDYENRLINKIKETSIPVSTEHLTTVKDNISKDLNNKTYRVRGDEEEHSFSKEKIDTTPGFVKGMYKSVGKQAPKYPELDATIFTGVTDIVMSGGKKVAIGEIVTSYKDRLKAVPEGYKNEAKTLSDDEKQSLKDSGYKIDMSRDYYRVPVEVDMKTTIPNAFSTQTISQVKSIAGEHNNPGNIRIAGSSEFETYPTLEDGFNAAMAEIERKKTDSPAIEANKKLRGRDGKETTVVDLIETWSPRKKFGGDNDDNVVDSYITDVLTTLGISADTPITQVPTAELALALAKHEDPAVYAELLAIMENNSDQMSQTAEKPIEPKNSPQPDYTAPVESKPKGQAVKSAKPTTGKKKIKFE